MARGEQPNSRKNIEKYKLQKGLPTKAQRETQKKGSEAGNEAQAITRSLNEDLRERCTPERIAKINDRILSMAEHGNLRAYELIRDGLGEKPQSRIQISGQQEDIAKMDEILRQMGMTDEQPDTIA